MLVEIEARATAAQATALAGEFAVHTDVSAWPVRLSGRSFLVVSGDEDLVPDVDSPLVLDVHSTRERGYWLVAAENRLSPAGVAIGDSTAGGGGLWCAAGPCALEDAKDALDTALAVRAQGANALRMGLFKPRSTPYHFAGKGRAGLVLLAEIREACGLPVVTEVLDPRDVEQVAAVADCLQVDTRNMVNRALLAELGRAGRPVLLMRGLRSSVTDWMRAAEFIFSQGNPEVVMCARGVASFDDSLAFQPDFGAIAEVRRRTGLPVIFDPSHSTGRADAVAPAALAAAAFGADGLIIESHVRPERTYRPGDGHQMYPPDMLGRLLKSCAEVRARSTELAPVFG